MPVSYQVVHDELLLDGNARLNLATFVTTWMEPEARQLIDECLDKNLIDKASIRRRQSSSISREACARVLGRTNLMPRCVASWRR